jgi:flagellin-specific chaperone FliS
MKATDRGTPMDKLWFDQETGTLMLDEYVVEMDSYRRIVEDETITDDELVEQTQRVASLLRQLEETLSPEAKALAAEALSELAVLSALQVKRLQAASLLPN